MNKPHWYVCSEKHNKVEKKQNMQCIWKTENRSSGFSTEVSILIK